MSSPQSSSDNEATPPPTPVVADSAPSPDQVEYWVERCSICFESRLDFYLPRCRDQYCLDCFSKYLTQCVDNAWGITVTKIKCPVCQDILPKNEWKKVVFLYN